MNKIIQAERILDIVLIEDNADDILLTQLALKDSTLIANLHVKRTGLEAIELFNKYIKEGNKIPDLILLDINLPVVNGLEVLKHIRSILVMSSVPVVLFTSSDSDLDLKLSYCNKANKFINKPNNIKEFVCVLEAIKSELLDIPII